LNGLEATKQIRAFEEAGRHQLIIALTANAGLEEAERCRQAGMDDFLTKPMHPSDLEEMFLKWLKPITWALPGEEDVMKVQEMRHENFDVGLEEEVLDPVQFRQLQCLDSAGDLMESFIMKLEGWKEKIDAALRDADIEQIRELAHALKGTSSNFGAFRLMKRCSEMEKDAVKKVFPEAAFLDEIMSEVRRAKEAVKKANPRTVNVKERCR